MEKNQDNENMSSGAAVSSMSLLPCLGEKSNFSTWKFRLKLMLEDKQVAYVLKEGDNEKEKSAEFIKDDSRAKSLIAMCVSDRYIEIIKNGKTAREMITLLENTFERKSVYNRFYLKRKLITLKCNEPLETYLIKFSSIVNDLQAIEVKIDDEDKICYLLSSLPKEYDPVITSIETMATEKRLTFDFVKARLLDAETKIITNKDTTDQESAFITCFTCGKLGHKSYECKDKTNEKEPHRGRGRGRAAGRGRRAARGQPTRGRGQRGQAQETSLASKAEVGFFASEYMFGLSDNSNITFIVDSGCTQHIISDQYEQYLTDIKTLQKSVKIYVANGQYIESNKKGKLKFMYKHIKINIEALIVNNISYNLLSVNKITEAGFHVKFNKTKAVIRDKNIYVICYAEGMLYKLNAQLCSEICNISNNKSDDVLSNIWHRRLGHLNKKGLGIMNLQVSEKVCGPCIEGKATRTPFKHTPRPRSRRVAEFLHTDIAGPTKNCGLNGEKYFMTVIDDYSHFCVVYPLVHKSEATEKLINYIIKLENETGNKVQRIRCDNGTEYTANRLKNFCNNKGINIEYTLPYTPQQNGVAERLNRTLCDKTRTLFAETNLPKFLWCEAIQCAAYQLNRSPSWAINFNTPCFMKNGHNDLSRLRVFGSKAWTTIIPKQDKLSKRARPTRMVGYNTVGYRLWNPEDNTIIISRDVIFDESDFKYIEDKESEEEQLIQEEIDYQVQKTAEVRDKEIRSTEPETTECQDIQIEEEKEKNLNKESGLEKKSRSGRIVKRPAHLEDYASNIVTCLCANTPNSFEEAVSNTEWKQAIQKELQALKKLDTWEEKELPTGKKAIDTKWIFKQKEEGTKKARLVVRGFQQKKEDIFDSNYAPVARHSTVRMFISKALQEDLKINQLDIPTAFLNGKLKSEIYIKVPQGLKVKNSNSKTVLKLKRALYGLTESPKCWNETIDDFAKNNGFQRSEYDYCMYYKNDCWMLIYVDDILIIGNGDDIIKELKQKFNAKNLGKMERFLGMEIQRNEDTIIIKQTNMIEKILQKFNMSDCKGMKTPMEINYNIQIYDDEEILDVPYRELIGSLIYLTVTSRPDLTFAVSYLSRYLDKPTEQLWKASKRVIRYLKETKYKGLVFRRTTDNNLYGFSDADWAGDRNDRKSVSGGIILHGVNPIAWFSKKQSCVALSTAESEYIAAAATAQELVNLKGLSQHLKFKNDAILLVDNIGAISMSKSYENSKRTKHIDIRAHFLKDIVEKGIIAIEYINSNDNLADIMTKSLCKDKFLKFRDQFMC